MQERRLELGICLAMGLVACGGHSPPPAEPVAHPALEAAPIAGVEEARDRAVNVSGIEGTLTEYQVRTTMEKRLEPLAECQAESMQRVPHLAGEVQVAIHVLRDGRVSEAALVHSSVGDRPTELCILQVVRDSRFPRPNGGEADVRWSMVLDEQGRGPDTWDAERITRQLKKYDPKLRRACELAAGPARIGVTAYVGRSGRVLAVGAFAKEVVASEELLDCVTEDIKRWRLPRTKRVAKVSFDI